MLWRGTGLAAVKRQAPVIEVTVIGTAPPPRSEEGTHPGRISCVRNTETPTGSGRVWWPAGRPTVREAEFAWWEQDVQEAKAGRRKPTGTGTRHGLLLHVVGWRITGRIPGLVLGSPKGVLTWAGEPVTMKQPDPSKLKGKLDT